MKSTRLVPLTKHLLNITDPKELEAAQPDFMSDNYFHALFSTPEEREKKRKALQQSKSIVEIAKKHYLTVLNNIKREETMKTNVGIARICFEANKQYCSDNKIFHTNQTFDEMSDEYREGVVAGVAEVIADPKIKPEEMHQKWLDSKEADGWVYGDVIDYEKKTHPNMVPYKKLSKDEQIKDKLFIGTVKEEMKK